jgi:hypothetical protein
MYGCRVGSAIGVGGATGVGGALCASAVSTPKTV